MSDEMKAGRELDARVAEKVMEWVRGNDLNWNWWLSSSGDRMARIQDGRSGLRDDEIGWSPSTEIAAAWEVVDHLRSKHWPREGGTDTLTGLQISFGKEGVEVRLMDQFYNTWEMDQSDSLPHAICKAALKAVT